MVAVVISFSEKISFSQLFADSIAHIHCIHQMVDSIGCLMNQNHSKMTDCFDFVLHVDLILAEYPVFVDGERRDYLYCFLRISLCFFLL